jgi:hypothetical protein
MDDLYDYATVGDLTNEASKDTRRFLEEWVMDNREYEFDGVLPRQVQEYILQSYGSYITTDNKEVAIMLAMHLPLGYSEALEMGNYSDIFEAIRTAIGDEVREAMEDAAEEFLDTFYN